MLERELLIGSLKLHVRLKMFCKIIDHYTAF